MIKKYDNDYDSGENYVRIGVILQMLGLVLINIAEYQKRRYDNTKQKSPV